jgi:thioester reductase-like protein
LEGKGGNGVEMPRLSIREALKGRGVLITGGTGFIGKVLVEKIVRDVGEVGPIYLLLRGENPQERLRLEILNTPIFQKFAGNPTLEKLHPIFGDLSLPSLGISASDLELLRANVNVIIHLAASIDFSERLDLAARHNVLASLELLELAKTFPHLQAFIHTSTAYVNASSPGTKDETLPQLDFEPEEVIQTILQMDTNRLVELTPSFLGGYPNTYAYTKSIAEVLLARRRGNIPLSFVRPSIVGAGWKPPLRGISNEAQSYLGQDGSIRSQQLQESFSFQVSVS